MAKDTYDIVMGGKSDNNVRFDDLRKMLESFNFGCRIKGDHFIYYRDDIPELINIQPKGSKAKGYEVKQIRILFNKYGI